MIISVVLLSEPYLAIKVDGRAERYITVKFLDPDSGIM